MEFDEKLIEIENTDMFYLSQRRKLENLKNIKVCQNGILIFSKKSTDLIMNDYIVVSNEKKSLQKKKKKRWY